MERIFLAEVSPKMRWTFILEVNISVNANRFFELVDKFLESENNTGGLIGVHCTHGVNRTGYFICRYMIERLGFEPSAAIQAFQEGRGYPIERQNYINDLKKCVRKGAVSIQEGNVNANSTYKSKGKPDLYMSTNTYSLHKRAEDLIKTIKANSSHWRANTDGLYRSVEPNSSYRGSNSNTLRKSKDNHATARSNGKELKNNRNKKDKKNWEYTSSYNRGHAKPESNCWRHDNSNYNFNSQGERNYGHTSTNSKHVKGSGSTCKGSRTNSNYSRKADTNQRDQSDDWRANNPYAQRNFGGHVVHTNFNVG